MFEKHGHWPYFCHWNASVLFVELKEQSVVVPGIRLVLWPQSIEPKQVNGLVKVWILILPDDQNHGNRLVTQTSKQDKAVSYKVALVGCWLCAEVSARLSGSLHLELRTRFQVPTDQCNRCVCGNSSSGQKSPKYTPLRPKRMAVSVNVASHMNGAWAVSSHSGKEISAAKSTQRALGAQNRINSASLLWQAVPGSSRAAFRLSLPSAVCSSLRAGARRCLRNPIQPSDWLCPVTWSRSDNVPFLTLGLDRTSWTMVSRSPYSYELGDKWLGYWVL